MPLGRDMQDSNDPYYPAPPNYPKRRRKYCGVERALPVNQEMGLPPEQGVFFEQLWFATVCPVLLDPAIKEGAVCKPSPFQLLGCVHLYSRRTEICPALS